MNNIKVDFLYCAKVIMHLECFNSWQSVSAVTTGIVLGQAGVWCVVCCCLLSRTGSC